MLFACGSNGHGQLGIGHDEDLAEWARVPLPLSGPISIAGGGNHTVIVEHLTGRAHISKRGTFVPVEHPSGQKWRLCAAGWAFTVLVDDGNSIWVSGDGPKGELGLGDVQYTSLRRIDWTPPVAVVSIKSGMAHTVVCLSDGSLWGWGASRKGQLNRMQAVVDRPTCVATRTLGCYTEDEFACGRDFTALLQNGRLRILGNTRWFESDTIDASTNSAVRAGWSSLLLLPEGRALGNNSHGQLASPQHPQAVALGSEHGLYRSGRTVKTWGWGEHGNCPPPHDFDGDIALFAGCATSFVYCT